MNENELKTETAAAQHAETPAVVSADVATFVQSVLDVLTAQEKVLIDQQRRLVLLEARADATDGALLVHFKDFKAKMAIVLQAARAAFGRGGGGGHGPVN